MSVLKSAYIIDQYLYIHKGELDAGVNMGKEVDNLAN